LRVLGSVKTADLEDEAGGDILYKEYMAELRASKALEVADCLVVPYAGIRLSDTDIDVDLDLVDARQQENVGITCGVDVVCLDNLVVSVGGSFIDQESVEGKVTYKF